LSGTLTVNAVPQAIVGTTSQSFESSPVAGSATGTTGYNSAYAPFYYSDSEQILRSDDLQATNQISFGSQGGGVGQFYGAYGIALDSTGRIYVADTYNCRIVRMDDMHGTNWVTYGGTCGSGQGQFYDPSGITVDSGGKIYVMDTGNSRLVRIDDMSGTNWISYGSVGSGVGQFVSFLSVTLDASDHIYVADTGNRRIVRMDDMAGTNWTALTQSPPVNGVSSSFYSPAAVAVDSGGKIFVADNEYYAPAVVRVDDMTGTNWTSLYVSPTGSTGLNSISVDSSGTVFTGGGGVRFIDDMLGVLTSSGALALYGTYYVFGVTPAPLSKPLPSAISLSPTSLTFSQNVGTGSAAQTVTISNFGGSPLDLSNISAVAPFAETNNCPSQLTAASTCAVSVTFTPTVTSPANELLTVTDDSGNAGTAQTVSLTGAGTAPGASVSPTTVFFFGHVVGTTSAARTVTLKSTGTGPPAGHERGRDRAL
jgi:sugar lactone lactonase YvrE